MMMQPNSLRERKIDQAVATSKVRSDVIQIEPERQKEFVTPISGRSACVTTFDRIGYLETYKELDVSNIAFPLLQLKRTMVIGIDCYHDSSTKGRSVGGFVASMNQTLTK